MSDRKEIRNVYDASGRKLRTVYVTPMAATLAPQIFNLQYSSSLMSSVSVDDYCDNYLYKNGSMQNGQLTIGGLKQILFPDGYLSDMTGAVKYNYFIKDHLGSVCDVVSIDKPSARGDSKQVNWYYSSGVHFPESKNFSLQPFKFSGKEFISMHYLNLYDLSARYYNPSLMRFTTMDPLAEKYYDISPYAYCLNNPVNFIDLDGKKVRYVNGTSQEFQRDFATAVNYLNNHKVGGMLAQLEASDKIYYISSGDKSLFNITKKTIYWNSTQGLLTRDGHTLSPASVLNHEVDHALRYDTNPKQLQKEALTKDKQYGNKEERRVITGSEQRTARALGEIKNQKVTRADHKGTLYKTESPTSVQPKMMDDIQIIGKSK